MLPSSPLAHPRSSLRTPWRGGWRSNQHMARSADSLRSLLYPSLCRVRCPVRMRSGISLLTWQDHPHTFLSLLRLRFSCFISTISDPGSSIPLERHFQAPPFVVQTWRERELPDRGRYPTMGLTLGASQKRALSVHVGNVIVDFYDQKPPLWSTVGTETQAELRRQVITRLKEKDCADVAEILEASSLDTAVEVIKRRFKTLREKKRREEERKGGAGKSAVSAG